MKRERVLGEASREQKQGEEKTGPGVRGRSKKGERDLRKKKWRTPKVS